MAGIQGLYSTGSTALGRSLLGFALAPLLSCLLVMSGIMLYFFATAPVSVPPPTWDVVVGAFLLGVAIGTLTLGGLLSYIGMGLIGVPAWLILRFTNNESGIAYTFIGAIGGWWIGPALGGRKWEGFPLDLTGACGGALALFLFWRIARRP